jgi:hypothetical protein
MFVKQEGALHFNPIENRGQLWYSGSEWQIRGFCFYFDFYYYHSFYFFCIRLFCSALR